ncbi:MAG: N-acetylmuramoyl-L-alanine amidase, partial [Burkholderiales bacterium]|nr:N-acetylmuramoyl-L-alanine amidase [Burkholderiales bacterium]
MKKSLAVSAGLGLLLSGCAGLEPHGGWIEDRGEYKADVASYRALGQNERIRYLVLHYTAVDDEESLRLLTAGGASAHYLVTSNPGAHGGKPVALQLVDEDKRAWHAGVSYWNGRHNLNDTSLGIEIVNLGYTDEASGRRWHHYEPAQLELVERLAADLIKRYGISPDNVVGHSDIAPQRKSDPGPLFPGHALAPRGIGAWPDAGTVEKYLAGRKPSEPASVARIQQALARY